MRCTMVHCRCKCRRMQSVKETASPSATSELPCIIADPSDFKLRHFFPLRPPPQLEIVPRGFPLDLEGPVKVNPPSYQQKECEKKANTGIPKSDCGASDLMQAVTVHPTGKQFHNQPIPPYRSPILKQNPRTNPCLQTAPAEGNCHGWHLASGIYTRRNQNQIVQKCLLFAEFLLFRFRARLRAVTRGVRARFSPRFVFPQPISTPSCRFLLTLTARQAIGLTCDVINSQLNQLHPRLAYAPTLNFPSSFQLTAVHLYVRRMEAFNGQ
ncbi:hypothetical protein BDV19DRAFT_337131 [Aspergillus venezuelensis]